MAAAALPQRIDLSDLFRDAWRIARAGAAAAACSARLCLGNGLRMAWARARVSLQRRSAAQALRERIAVNDSLMAETRTEIDSGWGVFRREPSELYAQLDRLHADGVALREELSELEAPAMVPQQAQQQQASGGAPDPVEPDPVEPEPKAEASRGGFEFDGKIYATEAQCRQNMSWYADDAAESGDLDAYEDTYATNIATGEKVYLRPTDLTTAKGLARVLVGRTAVLPLSSWDDTYVITGVERWTSPDGTLVRDYLSFDVSGNTRDGSKGPVKVFVERKGGGRGTYLDTKAGRFFWTYAGYCNSGNKRSNANELMKELLAPIR